MWRGGCTSGTWRREEGGRREKTRLIDEFVELTGYDRTYAKVLLRGGPRPPVRRGPSRRAGRPAAYGPQVIAALRVCAESLDWPCGKRLVEILPDLAKALEREGERSSSSRGRYRNRLRRLRRYGDERGALLSMRSATIDRRLTEARRVAKSKG